MTPEELDAIRKRVAAAEKVEQDVRALDEACTLLANEGVRLIELDLSDERGNVQYSETNRDGYCTVCWAERFPELPERLRTAVYRVIKELLDEAKERFENA
mgnify:CR=1 FL=1